MLTKSRQDALQSLAIERQRALLDAIGAAVGTPVVYLKAAFSDPVLYGGRGERCGVDIDVLVHPTRFAAYVSALSRKGFEPIRHASHPISALSGKDWTFRAPPGFMVVDLHRALAVTPWFDWGGEGPVERAIVYESASGPILSLAPEDQVLFLAAHCATHVFELDERHLEDTLRLLARFRVDWSVVVRRAADAHLLAALTLVADALAARGVEIPRTVLRPTGLLAARLAWLRAFITQERLGRRRQWSRQLDLILVLPVLSDKRAALPRFAANYAFMRAADLLVRGGS